MVWNKLYKEKQIKLYDKIILIGSFSIIMYIVYICYKPKNKYLSLSWWGWFYEFIDSIVAALLSFCSAPTATKKNKGTNK